MTNCYNCGHTGTFVLLVQFALAVPGPDTSEADPEDSGTPDTDRGGSDATDANRMGSGLFGDCRPERTECEADPDSDGLVLSVQCPACDSTDVGVTADDLLARYLSSITS